MTRVIRRWRLSLLTLLLTMLLVSPGAAQSEINLEIYTDNLFGIQSLRPAGWLEIADGTYSLNAAPDDFGILIAQSLPGNKQGLLDLVQSQFGLEGYPEPETVQTDFLAWDVYSMDVLSDQVGFYRMDMALSEVDGVAYLLMLQTSQAQYDNYHATVFEEVIDGFAPLVDAVQAPPPYTVEGGFTEEEFLFGTPEQPIPATLTLPTGEGSFPAVVIVHDAGSLDRDGTINALRPYRDLAYGLAANGIASLRYDKRTLVYPDMGESFALDDEVTSDALEAVRILRDREGINPEQVFVIGHGLGGMLVPRIAEQDGELAGAILLAAPARNYEDEDVLADQANYLISLSGGSASASSDLELVEGIQRIRDGEDPENVFVEPLAGYYESFTTIEQISTAQAIDTPMLILQGALDYQTLLIDFDIWQSELAEKENATFISYDDLQHTFMSIGQPGRMSVPADYDGAGYVAEVVIDDIAAWIGGLTGMVMATADVEMVAYASEVYGIEGVAPLGWSEVNPGVFARGEDPGDATILIQQAAPGATIGDIANVMLPSLQIDALPEVSETITTDFANWDVYQVEVNAPGITIMVDLALTETDESAYLILLQAGADEYSGLHDAVFLPALNAYTLASESAAVTDEVSATAVPEDAEATEEAPDATPETQSASGQETTLYEDPFARFTAQVPANWTISYEAEYGLITDPDEAIFLYMISEEGDTENMEQAINDAWQKVRPGFGGEYTEDDTQEIDSSAGLPFGDHYFTIVYEDGSEGQIVGGDAIHSNGILYFFLIDAELTALQRRNSQLQFIFSSVVLADGEEQVDLSDADLQAIDDEFIAELETFIADTMTRFETPGATVAIVQGDEIIYESGFGVKVAGEDDAVLADTRMMVGSTTKPMTTTVMAMLVDDGLMDWDTPAKDILPEFEVMDDSLSETITVANLVCACTGVPRRDFELIFNGDEMSAEDMLASLAGFEFFTDFGETFQYSNQLVATGGYVAAAAAGTEFGNLAAGYTDLMQERLLDPLNMTATTLDFETATSDDNYALPHGNKIYGEYEVIPLLYEETFIAPALPAGGIWSTVADMSQFMILQLNNGVAPDGTRLASEESLGFTRQPQVDIDANNRYGLGWILEGGRGMNIVSHAGNMLGYSSEFAFSPDADTGIVILSNQQGSAMNAFVRIRFFEMLYDLETRLPDAPTEEELAEQEANIAESVEATQFTFTEDDLPFATGTYNTDALGEFTVSLTEEGELILDSGAYKLQVVRYTDPDTEEVEYFTADSPIPGVPVTVNDDGTFSMGLGVVEYDFTLAE